MEFYHRLTEESILAKEREDAVNVGVHFVQNVYVSPMKILKEDGSHHFGWVVTELDEDYYVEGNFSKLKVSSDVSISDLVEKGESK